MNAKSQPFFQYLISILLLGLIVLMPVQAAPWVMNVTTTADGRVVDANCTLREAIQNFNANALTYPECGGTVGTPVTINIPAGTYTLTGAIYEYNNMSGDLNLTVANGILTLQGAGASNTILDGNANDRVLSIIQNGITLNLNDLTITNGKTSIIAVTTRMGAGLYIKGNSAATVTIVNCAFTNNGSITEGGAIGSSDINLSLTVANSTFTGNTASLYGNALVTTGGTITISGSTFENNYFYYPPAIPMLQATRGTVYFQNTNSTITNSTFTNNQAFGGGAIAVNGGNLNINTSTFDSNQAPTFPSGHPNVGGSAVLLYGTVNVTINDSTFYGNTTAYDGGAIVNQGSGNLTIQNTTISNNTVGGASYASVSNTGTGTLTVQNTIIAHTVGGSDCQVTTAASFTGNNNLIMNNGINPCGTPLVTADPLLGPLANNGGSIQTMALLAGSPAIDQGDDAVCVSPAVNGVTRPQGTHCDIGAFEYVIPLFAFSTTTAGTGSGTVTGSTANGTYNSGTAMTLVATPTAGSTFAGWNPATCVDGFLLTADTTCTATFSASQNPNSGNGLTPLPPTMNLKVDFRGNGTGSLKVENNKDYPGTGSTLGTCKNGDECSFLNLETASWVKITPTADAGSEFKGWSGSTYCQNGNPFMISNISCIAYFSTIQVPHYPLTVTKTGTGEGTVTSFNNEINCGLTCANNFDSTVEIELSAVPAANSKFIGWSGDCEGESSHTHLKVIQAKTCSAQFELLPPPPPAQYSLTITKMGNGNGIISDQNDQLNCGKVCNSSFTENSEIILSAKSDNDAQFIEWQGDCTSLDNPIKVTMTVAKSCVAVFDLKQPDPVLPPTIENEKLSVEKQGNGLGQVTTDPAGLTLHFDDTTGAEATADYVKGSIVKLIIETQEATTFTGFEGDPDCADSIVTMDVSKHCLAHFEQEQQPSPVVEPSVTPPITEPEPPVVIAPQPEPVNPPPMAELPCPTDRHYNIHLDEACDAEGKTIENFKVVYGGSLSDAIITGKLLSEEGLVSNLTIEPTAILEGGYVTNFMINKGLMKDFTFVGQQIKGGKLAGRIIIASKVRNEIRDVILAAGMVIQGKTGNEFVTAKLAGKIKGDAENPALLENVTIADNATLENVILGENVVLGQNVTQKNVTIVCTQQRANGKGFNAGGFPFDDDQTCFSVQMDAIALTLDSNSDLLGQTAEQLFVVIEGQKAFMFTGEWQAWNGELATLESGNSLDLKAVQTLVLPDHSQFTGNFKLYAGLRLTDGIVLYHQVR